VSDARGVYYRLTTRGVGSRVRLDIIRQGRRSSFNVALRSAPVPGREDIRDLAGQHPLDGVRVASILPAIAEELGLDDDDGVAIMAVKPGSIAAGLGFQPGDIVVQIGQTKIGAIADLEQALRGRQRLWQVAVKRGGRVLTLQVPG
jgi:membrane-associated protease RseP (regulator of RpoE activity)